VKAKKLKKSKNQAVVANFYIFNKLTISVIYTAQ